MRADAIVSALEYRGDRPYDEQTPGHWILPNGSVAASLDRGFLGAAGREVLRLWDEARAA